MLRVTQLKRCGACLKSGRVHLYCSSDCQRADWPEHRKACGQKLSAASDVPVFQTTSPSQDETLVSDHLRQVVLDELDRSRNAFWIVLDERCTVLGRVTVPDSLARPDETLATLRIHAYRALRESNTTSVDILACFLLPRVDYEGKPDPDAEGKAHTAPPRLSSIVRGAMALLLGLEEEAVEAICDPVKVAEAKKEGTSSWGETLRVMKNEIADLRTKVAASSSGAEQTGTNRKAEK
ncbi:hypothetical protein JCM10207_001367 [Rhodosporidiobolus poonsookiae]